MICNYHRLDGGHRDGTGHHKMLVTLIDWLNIFISSLLTITEIHIKTKVLGMAGDNGDNL